MQIPDYELLRRCGRGAYGEVWIARSRSGQLVALKLLDRSEQIEKEQTGLVNYARIVDSAYLIRILHIGEAGHCLYYTMELADNLGSETDYQPATLDAVLKREGRLSPRETGELGWMLLEGLKTLHAAQLVHRDLKPENILYVNGVPKLSDIGLVRSISQTLTLGGTLGFIPPERLSSSSTAKGPADDLYALGKVLYCCLTGNSVEQFPSFPVELINQQGYRHLNRLILTACDRDRIHRFREAAELQQALMAGIPRKKRFFSLAIRYRYRYLAIVLCFLIGLAISWLITVPADEAATPAGRQESVADPALKLGEIANRIPLSLSVSDGSSEQSTSFFEDPVYRKFSPFRLDRPPRRRDLVFRDDFFNLEAWDRSDSTGFTRLQQSLAIGNRGSIRLKQKLETPYALRFELDCSALVGSVGFQVVAPDGRGHLRSFYGWTLQREPDGELLLLPLEYQPEGVRKISFRPIRQPGYQEGFHRVEMVQTENLFRLYFDDELLLHAPSFFFGGFFELIADRPHVNNQTRIKGFELFSIRHDPACPIEEQYQLPGTVADTALEITWERLEYLTKRYTPSVMAQIFNVDEVVIIRLLEQRGLPELKGNPRGRQPLRRLPTEAVERVRNTLSERYPVREGTSIL